MSILFACVAAASFAVEQSVMISTASGADGIYVRSLRFSECLGVLHPLRLIEAPAGPARDRQ